MIERRPVQTVEVGLLELLLAVVRRKKFVILFTLAASVLAVAIVLIIPRRWSSDALISPIADNTAGLQLNSEMLGSLTNMPLLTSQKMELALDCITIMDSRTFRENLIRNFGMIDYFSINRPDSTEAMDIALRKLADKVIRIELEHQSNTIRLSVVTRDKVLSRDMASYMIEQLEYYIRNQKKIKSKLTREFMEQRTMEVKARIDTLMVMSRNFQEKGRVFAVGQQTEQVLKRYSELVADKLKNDIELELARQQYGTGSPKFAELDARAALLQQKIRDFEENNSGSLPEYLPQLKDLPEIGLQYGRIQLELRVMQQVYDFIYPLLESARLVEERDMPAIEIMDRPSLAGLHAYPRRLLLVSLAAIAALLLASLLAVLDAFMTEEQKSQLRAILQELTGNKNKQAS